MYYFLSSPFSVFCLREVYISIYTYCPSTVRTPIPKTDEESTVMLLKQKPRKRLSHREKGKKKISKHDIDEGTLDRVNLMGP